MKKLLWSILVLISLLVFIGLTSCLDSGDQERPGLRINSELILNKFWRVALFEDNGENLTHQFSDVYLQFLPNFRLSVTKGCQEFEGEWVVSPDSTFLVVRMNNVPAPLEQLSDEWVIANITNDQFHIIEQDDKGDEEFRFEIAPLRAINCQECREFQNIVTDSVWSVAWLQSPTDNLTADFKGNYLKFQGNGLITWFAEDMQETGDWAVTNDCQLLTLDWGQEPIYQNGELAKSWLITTFDQTSISLQSKDNADHNMRLIKGRFPACHDQTESFINTQWYINKFYVEGEDISDQFVGTGFTLLDNNQLVTEVLVGPAVLGTWVVGGDCDQLLVDLQVESLQQLSRNWTIKKIEDQSIYLVHENMEVKLSKGAPMSSEICNSIISIIKDGRWNVSRFRIDSQEKELLQSFTLQFQPDGNLMAEEGEDDFHGSWSLLKGCEQLSIDFGDTDVLVDLNADWYIEQFKKDEIKLKYQNKELILIK